jgi:hypothetical protein
MMSSSAVRSALISDSAAASSDARRDASASHVNGQILAVDAGFDAAGIGLADVR